MKCPICNNHDHIKIDLHAEGFIEGLVECSSCGVVWSINHGLAEIVTDPQENTFLQAMSETVEGDDYCWAG